MTLFHKNTIRFILCFLVFLSSFVGTLSAESQQNFQAVNRPFILKTSEEVKPGDAVSLFGENMSAAMKTHVYLVEKGNKELTIQQQDADGHVVRVILPNDISAGAYTLKVNNNSGVSYAYINLADPRWVSETAAYAGMKVKVMGRNLDASKFGGKTNTEIRLVPTSGGKPVEDIQVDHVTPFEVEFTMPDRGLKERATYNIYVNTNAGKTSLGNSWVKVKEDDQDVSLTYTGAAPKDSLALSLGVSWSNDFNWYTIKSVKAFGAVGNGTMDDTAAIQSGIDWLSTKGGGELYFPKGVYSYKGITMKQGVVLNGESRDATVLKYTGIGGQGIRAPYQSIMGIANLKMTVDESGLLTNFRFFDSFGEPWGVPINDLQSDRIFFYNVWMDASLTNSKIDFFVLVGAKQNVLFANNKLYGRAGVVYAPFVKDHLTIRDSSFDYSKEFVLVAASHAIYQNNVLTGHIIPGVSDVPIPNLHGLAMNPSEGWPLRHIYVDNNTVQGMGAGGNGASDGELIQAETPMSAYAMGPVTAASATSVTITKKYQKNPDWNKQWEVMIIKGKGLGQVRDVTAHTENSDNTVTVALNKKWDVQPDSTSKAIIRRNVEDMVVTNTQGLESSWGLVFYNVAYDSIIADNNLSNTQGVQTHAYINGDDLASTSYFVQLKRNTTIGKNTAASQFSDVNHRSTWIGAPIEARSAFADTHYAILNYGTEIKDNIIDRTGSSDVADWGNWGIPSAIPLSNRTDELPSFGTGLMGALVQGNTIINSAYGIHVGKGVDSTFIKGNYYKQVANGNQVKDTGSTNTVVYQDNVAAIPTPAPAPAPTPVSGGPKSKPIPTGRPIPTEPPVYIPTPTPAPTPLPTGVQSLAIGLKNVNSGYLRNNDDANGDGMIVTVGNNDLKVVQLGRYYFAGDATRPANSATFKLKIIRDSDKQEIGSAMLDMSDLNNAPDTLGFKYSALSTPVTLSAHESYHILMQRLTVQSVPDWFYDVPWMGNLDITAAVTTINADWTGDDGALHPWDRGGPASYGPLNFKYEYVNSGSVPTPTPTSTSAPTPTSTPIPGSPVSLVTGVYNLNASVLRNGDTGEKGFVFNVGSSDLSITKLGKYYYAGDGTNAANTGTYTLKLVQASDGTTVASTVLDISQGTADTLGFKYASLTAPVILTANTTYYLTMTQTVGDDYFYDPDWGGNINITNAATSNQAVWYDGTAYHSFARSAAATYGPLNFIYIEPN